MVFLVSWALLKTTMHNVKNNLTHSCHTKLYNSLQRSTPIPPPLAYKRTWVLLSLKVRRQAWIALRQIVPHYLQ